MDEDFILAQQLQEEWDLQVANSHRPQEPLSVVDASWELVDPTPDLPALFLQFNDQFFQGKLEAVEVKWSKRMTQCAGVCTYEGRGGMCSIRLSEPLLKLRPRKDLVETLLHEMIHAYLFVTNNYKDRSEHGPEFCKHMHRINRLTGANITIYHDFHDEVEAYQRHWWRCDGPCQQRKPYYGYVKRAMNRAPSANDYWWDEHQKTCGGTFIKIKEPENSKGKGKTKLGNYPVVTAETKDNPEKTKKQLLIPFSGKGYVLGKTINSPSPGKFIASNSTNDNQDILHQDNSTNALRPNLKYEVKSKQNGSSKKVPLGSPICTSSHQNSINNYFPKISVANQNAFRNVNGSPIKDGIVGSITKNISNSQRTPTSSNISLKNPLKRMELTSVTASQNMSGPENEVPSKRQKQEDKTALDNFLSKKAQLPSGSTPKCSSYPTVTTQNSIDSSSQRKMVDCPACQNEILESQINEHLDWCLDVEIIS